MTIIVEAINAAKASLMALYDDHLPGWDDEEGRLAFISATEEVFEHLDDALYEATKAAPPSWPGPWITESEDGTVAASQPDG